MSDLVTAVAIRNLLDATDHERARILAMATMVPTSVLRKDFGHGRLARGTLPGPSALQLAAFSQPALHRSPNRLPDTRPCDPRVTPIRTVGTNLVERADDEPTTARDQAQ